ncbi:MAG: peptidoglycan bridge formation glycyltransferase FemA/FemB family protein [Treponema sp.]|jgi:lipid II:glycine glycyltransferase (peptidoglycan interpeptide bridge formation enzyme)|nr:peptidoglycan bridge formation glycyltransferase FemA/FemB family protein [Treponema sp.]
MAAAGTLAGGWAGNSAAVSAGSKTGTAGTAGARRFRGLVPADLAACSGAAAFLQSGFWGSFKARFGWNARAFLADWGEGRIMPLLIIRRRLGLGVSFAYAPWGPELPPDFSAGERQAALEDLARALKELLPGDTAFVRFDPPWYTRGAAFPPPLQKPLVRAAADVQPPDSVVIDLDTSEAAILRGMKNKWRYNIRLAEKKGVSVRRAEAEELPLFYRLYRETARRDGIAIHSAEYYAALFAHSREWEGRDGSAGIRLYIAEYEGEALAAIITLFRGGEAVYLYGASSDQRRNLMAPYALQWKAIRDARDAGCLSYDLYGIPPGGDPSHPMAGLYRFKTGFGGSVIHRPGSWDLAYKPLTAALFRTAEGLRKLLTKARKRPRKKTAPL